MDRLHLKYVMLNKNNVWYRLYYNYATLHAPPPSPHNKSYDNIDIGGLVVWLTYTYTLIVIISINNTTYQTMFAIIYTSTCIPPPPPPLLKRNAIIATIVYLCSFNWPCISSHILRKIFVLFLFKVYVISSQSVRSDYLLV